MQVTITPKALRQYDHLPKSEQKKVKKKLSLLETDPFLGKKLGGEFEEQRSIKAWPYRIIYVINELQNRIYIVSIMHRQGAYK